MKHSIFFYFFCFCLSLTAQEHPASGAPLPGKGVLPVISTSQQPTPGSHTRAVVIGISDYQDPQIPDLKYADRDAEAFHAWLQSPAGGSVPFENIQLLLNESATMGKVAMALWALMAQCSEGDQVIIYFSGHGDVETRIIAQPGYWLCWDAPSYAYVSGGCFNVRDLQNIVSTLSTQNKARVLLISDACHAGKLAGSENGGPQLTALNLAKQFANEVKILSCQPNEFSLEGTQWGGGHGCFSYHLTNGLYGLADRNGDAEINLLELENYLEDLVPAETAPHPQLPFAVGNKMTRLARVDAATLAQIKAGKAGIQPTLERTEPRGMEDWVLANTDSSILQLYAAFNAALERMDLMPSDSTAGRSADDYYRRLILEPSLGPLHGLMTRNFAAALIDESQQVTNKLIKTDPYIVSDVISRPFVFDHIHHYIGRAIELLGNEHFLFRHLKAKQLYFEAKTFRTENYPGWSPDSLVAIQVDKLKEGLEFDSLAVYIYLDLAFQYGTYPSGPLMLPAIPYAEKAVKYAPASAIANFWLGFLLQWSGQDGLRYLEKAQELDSTFLLNNIFLGLAYSSRDSDLTRYRYYLERYIRGVTKLISIRGDSIPVLYYSQLGHALSRLGRISEAEKVLLKAAQLANAQDPFVYLNLEIVYIAREDWKKAAWAIETLIHNFPTPNPTFNYEWLGFIYRESKQPEKAEAIYKTWLQWSSSNNGESDYPGICLAEFYQEQGRQAEADSLFHLVDTLYSGRIDLNTWELHLLGRAKLGLYGREAIVPVVNQLIQDDPDGQRMNYQIVAFLYAVAGMEDEAIKFLELFAEKHPVVVAPPANMWMNWEFARLHKHPGFQAIIKKYLPDGIY